MSTDRVIYTAYKFRGQLLFSPVENSFFSNMTKFAFELDKFVRLLLALILLHCLVCFGGSLTVFHGWELRTLISYLKFSYNSVFKQNMFMVHCLFFYMKVVLGIHQKFKTQFYEKKEITHLERTKFMFPEHLTQRL